MKDIAIYGAGGFGREVASILKFHKEFSNWNLIGFFDDGKEKGDAVAHFGPVLGGIVELNSWSYPLDVVLAFGVPGTIETVYSKINNPLVEFPNIIDPTFVVVDPETFTIGKGNIICGGSCFTTNVEIGNFNLFNGHVIVGHDARIGDYNVFMFRSNIGGQTNIGNRNLFGMSSFVRQGLRIGNDVTISPLSAILSNPKDGNTYIGNPAKIFRF